MRERGLGSVWFGFLLLVLALFCSPAQAIDNIFTVQSGDWSNPATWNLMREPSGGDLITISDGHTVAITDTRLIGGGGLGVAANAQLNVAVGGSLTVLNIGAFGVSPGGAMDNFGTLEFGGTGNFNVRVVNRPGGELRLRSASVITLSGGTVTNQGTFVNNGEFLLRPNGTTEFVNSGTLRNNWLLDNQVQIRNLAGATLENNVVFLQSRQLENAGLVRNVPSARIEAADVWENLAGGTVENRGEIKTLGGVFAIRAGAVFEHYGSLITTVPASATVAAIGPLNKYCGATIDPPGMVVGNVVNLCVSVPTVSSPTATTITDTSALLGGNVTADGGGAISARGVVLAVTSANANPELGGPGVVNVAGTGSTGVFTVSASGLATATDYSFRAYASNATGTGYSAVGTFRTANPGAVPQPPTITLVSAAFQAALVYFTPGAPGSSPTTGFTATSSPGGVSSSGCTDSPCLVTGLTNGQSYTFTVTARNTAGNSAPSVRSRPVTPNAPFSGAAIRLEVARTAPLSRAAAAPSTAVEYTVSVRNEGPDEVSNLSISVPRNLGMTGVQWTCTVTDSVCAPASGSGAVATTLNLGEYQLAQVVLTGTVDPTTNYVEISAAATVPAGVNQLGVGNLQVFIDPIGPDAIYKSGYE